MMEIKNPFHYNQPNLDARYPGGHLAKKHSVPVKLERRELESLEGALHRRLHCGKQQVPHIPKVINVFLFVIIVDALVDVGPELLHDVVDPLRSLLVGEEDPGGQIIRVHPAVTNI